MATDQKLSNLIASQLPQFVRDDHLTFTAFVEAYYEYLEQSNSTLQWGKTVERAKNLISYRDVDKTLADFSAHLYAQFLKAIPEDSLADRNLILKHVKDFYRAKGTEKSFKFLLRVIANKEATLYYPKLDILRVSDGKWYIQKTLRVADVKVDGEANTTVAGLDLFTSRQITGNTSNATAIIDKAEQFYEAGILINELTLSAIDGTFASSETIHGTYFRANNSVGNLTANLFSGQITTVTIIDGGSGYRVGNQAIIESSTGSGAIVEVSDVSDGNVANVAIITGGAGFRVGDFILFTGGSGSGANASVSLVDESGNVHSNTYNIVTDIIDFESNTTLSNAIYTNINSANANTVLGEAFHRFLFTNTGPAVLIAINSKGTGYTAVPTMDIIANTAISSLGILGRMNIANAGSGYAVGEKIEFINVPGGHGDGASANITEVDGSGGITAVRFEEVPGWLAGGSGYSQVLLPTANIITSGGSGANVVVTTVLGDGESLQANTTTLGTILQMTIIAGGSGYETAPILNFSTQGSGSANILATIVQGLFEYDGRYLNDDGHLSSFNYLQDRDYYQNYSYVVRVAKSLDSYKNALLSLLHPAGTKLFAEYLLERLPIYVEADSHEANIRIESSYTANAVYFNGAAYYRRTSGLSVANSRTGTLSFWIDPYSLPSNNNSQIILSGTHSFDQSYMTAAGIFFVGNATVTRTHSTSFGSHVYDEKNRFNSISIALVNNYVANANTGTGCYIDIRLGGADGNTTAIQFRSDANSNPITGAGWTHVLASWNTANRTETRLLLDNIESTIIISNNSLNVGWNRANITIGASANDDSFLHACLADLFLTNVHFNLANTENIIKFNSHLYPTNLDNTLASTEKVLFFKSSADSANLNSGTGGSFDVIFGAFTNCANTPSTLD